MTAFFRVQRGIESEVEDSFTIILQYDGSHKDLLVTVKTCVVSPMARQLKFWIRGSKGSYIKYQQRSSCPQEEAIGRGESPLDEGFAVEPESLQGALTTYDEFDGNLQTFDKESQRYVGQYPTVAGRWIQLYQNVADAISSKSELFIKPSQVRDVLRIIELARESHQKGTTVAWK